MSELVGGAPLARPVEPRALYKHPAFRWPLLAVAAIALAAPLFWAQLSAGLFDVEFAIAALLPDESIAATGWLLLPLVGFGCGLLASLSPCILPLIPLNVATIGAADASGWRAVDLSGRFVLGAAVALAVLGLAGDLAGFLLIEQRGPVLLIAGLLMLYFGLVALEVAPVPFAGGVPGTGRRLGPFATGAAFSLVTTPCASPLLAAVLTAAAARGVPGLSVASMLGFAVGYTGLVFLAGVFGGSLVRRMRERSFEAPRAAAAALLVVTGAGFAAAGITWF